MHELRIGDAMPADLEGLLPLMKALYAEDGTVPLDAQAARRALAELLEHPELGRVWVAAVGSRPVGYVVLTLGFSLEYHGRDAFIDEIYVGAECRGRGVGRALLERAEEAARREGVRAVHLEVEPGNARAREVYRRAGYEDHERRLSTKRL